MRSVIGLVWLAAVLGIVCRPASAFDLNSLVTEGLGSIGRGIERAIEGDERTSDEGSKAPSSSSKVGTAEPATAMRQVTPPPAERGSPETELAGPARGGGFEVAGVSLGMPLQDAKEILGGAGYSAPSGIEKRLELGLIGTFQFTKRPGVEWVVVDAQDRKKRFTSAASQGGSADLWQSPVSRIQASARNEKDEPLELLQSYVARYGDPDACIGGAGAQKHPSSCTWRRGVKNRTETLTLAFGALSRGQMVLLTLEAEQRKEEPSVLTGKADGPGVGPVDQTGAAQEARVATATLYPGNALFAVEGIRAGMSVGEAKAVLKERGFETYNYDPCKFRREIGTGERIVTVKGWAGCDDPDAELWTVSLAETFEPGSQDATAGLAGYEARLGRYSYCRSFTKSAVSCTWKRPDAPHVEFLIVEINTRQGEREESLSFKRGHAKKVRKPAFVEAQVPVVQEVDTRGDALGSMRALGDLLALVGKPYGQALSSLQRGGYALTDALACRVEGKFKENEPPSEIEIFGHLNHTAAGGTIRADTGSCDRTISAFQFAHKTRYTESKDIRTAMKYDTAEDMTSFLQSLGETDDCHLNRLLSRCHWSDSPALPGSEVWVESARWPGGVNRSLRVQPISQ